MPRINFSFEGWCRADIDKVSVTETGEQIDVTDMAPGDLCAKLNSGEFCVSLGDHLYSGKSEINISDFEGD
jgi:hypothetical protein